MEEDRPPQLDRLTALQRLERLSEALRDRPAGELFAADLREARALARHDPRFERLAAGLEAATLGDRLDAIDSFFGSFTTPELAALRLPPNLDQLRLIYLSSRPDWPGGG